jgi:hypothetical protein
LFGKIKNIFTHKTPFPLFWILTSEEKRLEVFLLETARKGSHRPVFYTCKLNFNLAHTKFLFFNCAHLSEFYVDLATLKYYIGTKAFSGRRT